MERELSYLDGMKPLSAFPVVEAFTTQERWLEDPTVRVHRAWEFQGWDSRRFTFYLLRNDLAQTLGMLIGDGGQLAYCRLYQDAAVAASDSALWARDILAQPDSPLLSGGGTDENGVPWTVRLVSRRHTWEVHITYDGLIPFITEFKTYEAAAFIAEDWLTVFHVASREA
jgi:hypothetical protein